LRRAKTSLGDVMVESDPQGLPPAPQGALELWLLRYDVGLPGVKIAFVDDPSFEERTLALVTKRQGPGFARSLVFRRRGNAIFFYQRLTDDEVVRIAQGCLGGPPYAGDGGEPPEDEPVPDPAGGPPPVPLIG
jgi:hypothetical protein